MVEFDIKEHNGKIYLPKELRQVIGSSEGKAIANFKGVLLFDKETSYEDVLESLEIIKKNIKHRAEKEAGGNEE